MVCNNLMKLIFFAFCIGKIQASRNKIRYTFRSGCGNKSRSGNWLFLLCVFLPFFSLIHSIFLLIPPQILLIPFIYFIIFSLQIQFYLFNSFTFLYFIAPQKKPQLVGFIDILSSLVF